MITTNEEQNKLVITLDTASPEADAEHIPMALLNLLQNQDDTSRSDYNATVYYTTELLKSFIPNERQWVLIMQHPKPPEQ